MASVEVHIDLAQAGPVRLREEISGRVTVRAHERMKCQAVDVVVGCHTTLAPGLFRVGRDATMVHEKLIYESKAEPKELLADNDFHTEFSTRLPAQPISFQGKTFGIAWFVRVRVRLPLRIDLREEKYFNVLPAQSHGGPIQIPPDTSLPVLPEVVQKKWSRAWKLLLANVATVTLGVLLISIHVRSGLQSVNAVLVVGAILLVIGFPPLPISVGYAVYALARRLFKR